MVRAFLDTAVIVDLHRNYPPAVAWYGANQDTLVITPIVWMEVIDGVLNKQDQAAAAKLMKNFDMEEPSASDIEWAMDAQMKYHLRYGMDMMDCLIAAPCARLNIPLYTRNLKHLAPLLNTLAIQPY